MKSVFIFFFYFLAIVSVAGFAAFLMFHNVEGWGWLVFIDFCLVITQLNIKD